MRKGKNTIFTLECTLEVDGQLYAVLIPHDDINVEMKMKMKRKRPLSSASRWKTAKSSW
jgi:hypothetical protein